jgi:serine/threonine protein kinase
MQAGARPAGPDFRRGSAPPASDRDGPAAVPRFKGYACERRLSEGNPFAVWRATLPAGTSVAIKVAHEYAGAHAIQALESEFGLTARLEHPAIIRAMGWLAEPPWFGAVFEDLAGGDWVALAGAPIRCWVRQAEELLGALTYLHGMGFVHRDLKARNVRLDHADRVRLIDFGSCRRLGARWSSAGTTVPHRPDGWVGKRVGYGDDVYALAVLFAEMLTGDAGQPVDSSAPGTDRLRELVNGTLAGTPEDCERDLARFSAVISELAAETYDDE